MNIPRRPGSAMSITGLPSRAVGGGGLRNQSGPFAVKPLI
ncbi:hypothetical protein CU044_6689 [Streptomyces sp. L-9-10]|nr:hypothetical protein CU044_6689 [Streptomyces sp. L-9-10]